LAKICDRGMELSITVSGDSLFVASELGECELFVESLQDNS